MGDTHPHHPVLWPLPPQGHFACTPPQVQYRHTATVPACPRTGAKGPRCRQVEWYTWQQEGATLRLPGLRHGGNVSPGATHRTAEVVWQAGSHALGVEQHDAQLSPLAPAYLFVLATFGRQPSAAPLQHH